MKRDVIPIGLSFLDALCCGLGGAVLLAIIFSTVRTPTKSAAPSTDSILIEVRAEIVTDPAIVPTTEDIASGRRIGLLVRPPGGSLEAFVEDSVPADGKANEEQDTGLKPRIWSGYGRRTDGAKAISQQKTLWMEIPSPQIGAWTFQAYVADSGMDRTMRQVKITSLRWWSHGKGGPENPRKGHDDSFRESPSELLGMRVEVTLPPP